MTTKRVKSNLSGIAFSTTSPRGIRTESIKDMDLRNELLSTINTYNATCKKSKQFYGFCIGFIVDKKVYAALFDTATGLQRVKRNTSVDKILQPIGIEQIRTLYASGKMDYICTVQELEQYQSTMRVPKKIARNRGIAFQKMLCKQAHISCTYDDLTRPLSNGGDLLYGHYEVKLMELGTSQGGARV